MGRATLLTLGAVALALATYLALGGRPAEPPTSSRLIAAFARDRVDRMTIAARGRAPIRLRRRAGAWWLEAPLRDRAETPRVDQILSAVEFVEPRRWIGSTLPGKLAQYGLRPPRIELTLAGPPGAPVHRISIGAADPSGRATYLRLGGAEVCVVSGELARLVDVEPAALRARTMVALTAAEIDRVSLRKGGGQARLRRRDGRWWVTTRTGLVARGHAGRIQRLLGHLSGLVAESFPAPAERAREPKLEIEIVGRRQGGARRAQLRLGGPCPGRADRRLVARRERRPAGQNPRGSWLWACVDEVSVKPLLVEQASLLDRRITGLVASRLAKIRVVTQGRELILARHGGAWRTGSSEADPDVVARWVEALGVVGELAPASAEEISRVTQGATEVVLEEEGGQRERILLKRRPSGRSAVWREGEEAVLWVPSGSLPPLDARPLHFRSRDVLSLPRFAVARIETLHYRPAGALGLREVVVRGEGARGGFVVTSPVAMPADDEHVAALLDRLSNLRAVRFAAAGAQRSDPRSPKTELVFSLRPEGRPAGPGPKRLVVERTLGASGPCWAMLVGGGSTRRFALGAADCALLVRLRGTRRPAHGVDPSELRRIRIEGALGTRDFARRELTWYEGKRVADPGTVARLVERLTRIEGKLTGYGERPAAIRAKLTLELAGRRWRAVVGPQQQSGGRTLTVLNAKGGAEGTYLIGDAALKTLREALGSSPKPRAGP